MVLLHSFFILSISSAAPSIFLPFSRISLLSNHAVQDYISFWSSSYAFFLISSLLLDSQLYALIFLNSIFLFESLSIMLFHFFPPQSDGKMNRMKIQILLNFFSSPSTCCFTLVNFQGSRLRFFHRMKILFHIFNREVSIQLDVDLKNTSV